MPSAELPPPPPAMERTVWHDCRMVHDCAALTLSEFTASPVNRWVVAEIEPDPDSGAATIPGATINGATGGLVVPAGAAAVLRKTGTYKRLSVHGLEWPAEGRYTWDEPLGKRIRGIQPEDLYSPFAQGGTVYFRGDPAAKELAQFGVVRVVAPEWGALIPQAAAYLRTQPAVPDDDNLKRLLSSQNPVLALLAFRELVAEHRLSGPDLLAPVERMRGPVRAVMARIVLDNEQPVMSGKTVLDGIVERASQREALLPLASAAFSAVQLGAASPEHVARARAFLGRVRLQAEKFPPAPGAADLLPLMARLAGLSE